MISNSLPHERAAIVSTIDPDVLGVATHDGDWVKADDFQSFMAVFLAGTLGASATFTCSVLQATDNSGTGAKAITGLSSQVLSQASPDGSDKQIIMSVRPEQLDLDNSFVFIAPRIVVATAACDGGAVLFGHDPRHAPAGSFDLASVASITSP